MNFQGKTLKNEDFNLEDYKGMSVMLLFWSQHCNACIKELPDLNRIIQHNKDSSFVLLSMMDESAEYLRDTSRRFSMLDDKNGFYRYREPIHFNTKINFEIIVNGKQIRKQLGIPFGFPQALFIDEDMIIRTESQSYSVYNNFELLSKKVNYLLTKDWSCQLD